MKNSEGKLLRYIFYLLSFEQMVVVNNASDLIEDVHESMSEKEVRRMVENLDLEHEEVQSVNSVKVKTFEEFIRRENNLEKLLDD